MNIDAWVAGAIFVVAYLLIALERVDRTLVALAGGLLVVALGVIDQDAAFAAVDLNVIFLLAGMMVIASILARTGFFEWLAIRSVILSGGRPIRLMLILATVTAVLSAFLDNVTTVVLMTPVTLSIAHRLRVSPVPYLISSIFASNIGGTATLIGDPPNILIGSAAGLGFGDFLANLAPVVVVIFVAFTGMVYLAFRGHLQVPDEHREEALERTEEHTIKDKPLLVKALVVAGGTIAGFLAHSALGVEPATIALLGATVLMLVAGVDVHKTLREIEWSTLFFFIGLFILVEAVVEVGLVGGIADWLAAATQGEPAAATIGMLWFSALASAIIDNIPYTATAIPVVERLAETGMAVEPLWWALALGACLGGNLTIVGASANVVVANVAQRAGHPIRFMLFLRYGAVVVAVSLVISTAYLWLRYLS
jgi:Na+/H+ antiporter NhaD/arsenite permease-like protein